MAKSPKNYSASFKFQVVLETLAQQRPDAELARAHGVHPVSVEQYRPVYGLNACLQALRLSKGTWHYRQHRPDPAERDTVLKSQIRAIIEANPGYGYRPIQTELEAQTGQPVNPKRIRRVLRTYDLGLPRNLPKGTPHPVPQLIRQLGSSVNLVQGRLFAPLEAFSTDFTELIYDQGHRKAQLMVLLISSVGGREDGPSVPVPTGSWPAAAWIISTPIWWGLDWTWAGWSSTTIWIRSTPANLLGDVEGETRSLTALPSSMEKTCASCLP